MKYMFFSKKHWT